MTDHGDRWADESIAGPSYRDRQAPEPSLADEASLVRAFRVGAAIGLVVFLFVLTGARTTLVSWAPAADFYDAQADSFLDGRLDIDPERLGIEGFSTDGRTYMYQPPWPAMLRLPVAAVTDAYEGRLGQVSMLVAVLVALSATRRILVSARRTLHPDGRITTLERAGGFALGLIVAGGSVPVFLASRAWVYHESALWGMAWTLAAFAALLAHRRHPTWGSLVLVGAATLGAVGSRASVGAGACAALGVLAVIRLVEGRDRPWRGRLAGPAGAVALLVTAAVPAVAYAGLNVAKFGTVAAIPFEDQAFTRLSPARQAMLAGNDGTLFGPQFAPTTALHYLRPTGIRFSASFPFVDFPPPGGPVVGDATFDLVDRTASIPASLPALVVPALAGAWVLGRRRRLHDPAVWAALAFGGLVGTATIIPFGYVAHRYLADAMPLLVPLAVLGFLPTTRPDRSDRLSEFSGAVAWVGLVVLVPFTLWANIGLATVYQRLYIPAPDPDLVAGLVDARLAVGAAPVVVRAEALPGQAETGDLAVIGDCAALYVWDGTPVGEFRTDAWIPVERTEAAGHVRFFLPFDELTSGGRHPVVVAPSAGPTVAWVERQPGGAVVAGISRDGEEVVGEPVQPAGRTAVDVVLDPFAGEATVRLGDEILVTIGFPRGADVSGLVIGSAAGVAGFEETSPAQAGGDPGRRGDDGSLCRQTLAAADAP